MPRVVINPKLLRHVVSIEQRKADVSRNAAGEEQLDSEDNWETVADMIHADLKPLSGRQLEHAQSIAASVSHLVTMRYNEGITQGQRLRLGNRIFQINAVIDEQEMHVKLSLYCTEGGV
jgi:SPP1 family predicted phage head-tail adaptor